ncbi:MAG: hypothetical protein ABSD92_13315, partial [Candidatus Bathyarchaeia archaeon]
MISAEGLLAVCSSKCVSADLLGVSFEGVNLKCLNKKIMDISGMPSSRKNQKKIKYIYPNRKNRGKIYLAIGLIAVAAVVISAFIFLGHGQSNTPVVYARATALTTPAGEYSANGTQVVLVTSKGPIWIQMRDDKPITTQNF